MIDNPLLFPLQSSEPTVPLTVIEVYLYLLRRVGGSWSRDLTAALMDSRSRYHDREKLPAVQNLTNAGTTSLMRLHRSLTVASALAFSVAIAFAADKPRVFVTGAIVLQVEGSGGGTSVSGVADGTAAKGLKLFREGCPSVEVTTQQDKADYIVGVTNSGSGAVRRGRRVEVFTPEGAVVFASLTRRLKNAVKDACGAITKGGFPHSPDRLLLHR